MKRLLVAGIAAALLSQAPTKSHLQPAPTAAVRVIAYEANGRYLGAPDVQIFADDSGKEKNLAARFNAGVAEGIPYGMYRIEGKEPYYYSDETYVGVYQHSVTIILGLPFAVELPEFPPVLSGRVVGFRGSADHVFAKLVGVYQNLSLESSIGSDGQFSFGGVSDGKYVLWIVSERGILASRNLKFPYTGLPRTGNRI